VSFADDVAALPVRKGPQCTAGQAAEKLSPEDRDEFEACLADPNITDDRVRRALEQRGIVVGIPALQRHRRRGQGNGCKCPPWEQAT
jgi:hypothetical protein